MNLGPFDLNLVFAIVNTVVLIFNASIILEDYWWKRRDRVSELYNTFTSESTAQSRDVVGGASRKKRLASTDVPAVRFATFDLLWKIERLHLIKNDIRKSGVTHEQGRLLYRHLERIVKEINHLFHSHPDLGDFTESISAANEALDTLKPLRTSWERPVARPPKVRVHNPGGHLGQGVRR